jgi:hypothetical protein
LQRPALSTGLRPVHPRGIGPGQRPIHAADHRGWNLDVRAESAVRWSGPLGQMVLRSNPQGRPKTFTLQESTTRVAFRAFAVKEGGNYFVGFTELYAGGFRVGLWERACQLVASFL